MSTTTIIPESQFNALPYATVAQFLAASGDVEIVPGLIVRYYGPSGTGINGLPGNASDPITHRFMAVSSPLNCRGCRRFTFSLAVLMRYAVPPGTMHDADWPINVFCQAVVEGEGGAMIQPVQGDFANQWAYCGPIHLPVAYPVLFPPPTNPADPATYPKVYKSASCSWEVGDVTSGGSQQAGLTGSVIVKLDAVAGIGGAPFFNALIYGSLWASS
jgi:hypothetical protein